MRVATTLGQPLIQRCAIVSRAGPRGGPIRQLVQSRWSSTNNPPGQRKNSFRGEARPPWSSFSPSVDERPLRYDLQDDNRRSSAEEPNNTARKPEQLGYMTEEVLKRWGRDRLPRDLEITDPWIMVIQNDNPPKKMSTQAIIRFMTPEKSLRMLEPFKPADPTVEDSKPKLALCKVVVKSEEYKHMKSLKAKKRIEKGVDPKTLTITWNIGPKDLKVKLKRLMRFLNMGCKVDVQLYSKKNGMPACMDQAEELVTNLRKTVVEAGFKEYKCEGVVMGSMIFTFAPKEGYKTPHLAPKSRKAGPQPVVSWARAEQNDGVVEKAEG
ncbi:hypothetical protein L249_7742 [Ophiocordyceps polyrhachis-furcata BCC 54312]|uniref:Translation initiation factor 3 N-terminal domain-containing protein n=1 Tax=Ophiocordyceps polyrhachis-furcata BCC 54312 TaxID=1330021 RepID=A0A367LBM1_9HYPO|nr:hypothetical protein L249_7742 [Ophiocordyceps polyrhachis-furcata BCC 54312]